MTSMTGNRTTELRGKLTERGVEYRGDDASYTFATHWTDSLGRGCSFVEEVYDGESKTMFVSEPSARNITPEQAIAATLGSEREAELVRAMEDVLRHSTDTVWVGEAETLVDRMVSLGVYGHEVYEGARPWEVDV